MLFVNVYENSPICVQKGVRFDFENRLENKYFKLPAFFNLLQNQIRYLSSEEVTCSITIFIHNYRIYQDNFLKPYFWRLLPFETQLEAVLVTNYPLLLCTASHSVTLLSY